MLQFLYNLFSGLRPRLSLDAMLAITRGERLSGVPGNKIEKCMRKLTSFF